MAPAARITGRVIDVRNGAFWYPFCSSCLGKVTRDVCGRWRCPRGCGDVTVLQHRYRLVLQVSWPDSTVQDVVLFGQCLDPVFGVSADEFVGLVAAQCLTHDALLDCLRDTLAGQHCLFDVASRRPASAPACRESASHVTARGLLPLCAGFRPVRDLLVSQHATTALSEDDGCSCIGLCRLHCDRLRDNSLGSRSVGPRNRLWQPGSFLCDENSSPRWGIVCRQWSQHCDLPSPSLTRASSTSCVAGFGQPTMQRTDTTAAAALLPYVSPLPLRPGARSCEPSSAVAATLDSWSSWDPDSPTTPVAHVSSRSSFRTSLSCKPAATVATPVVACRKSRRRTGPLLAEETCSAGALTSSPLTRRLQSELHCARTKLGNDSFIPCETHSRADSMRDHSAELHHGCSAPAARQHTGTESTVGTVRARTPFQRTSLLHSPSSGSRLQSVTVQPMPTAEAPAGGRSASARASKRRHPSAVFVHSTPIAGGCWTPNGWSSSKRRSLLQAASPVLPDSSQSSPSGRKLLTHLSAAGMCFNISSPLFSEHEESTLT